MYDSQWTGDKSSLYLAKGIALMVFTPLTHPSSETVAEPRNVVVVHAWYRDQNMPELVHCGFILNMFEPWLIVVLQNMFEPWLIVVSKICQKWHPIVPD